MGKGTELPTNPKGWVEFLGSIDYKEHKKAIVALGAAAAVGVGVGVVIKAGSKRLKVRYADRHYEEKGVISVVETGEHAKIAAGLPTSEAALEGVADGPEIFVMDEAGLGRPHSGQMDPAHVSTLQWLGGRIADHFRGQDDAA
jgi:hypothetical protein